MLNLLKLALSLAFGAAIGLGATYATVQRGIGFGAIHAGPWTARPAAGSMSADPYTRAALARSGEIPLGLAEGLEFVARTDNDGKALDAHCTYLFSGAVPTARYWTLTATDTQGFLVENPAAHYGFTSREIVRVADGSFTIAVGRAPHAGNWLPLGNGIARFLLVLRLYETPLSATTTRIEPTSMPAVRREACP